MNTLPEPADLLPHRPPFLFVDRLTLLEPGIRAAGSWSLTGEEWFFGGALPRPTDAPGRAHV